MKSLQDLQNNFIQQQNCWHYHDKITNRYPVLEAKVFGTKTWLCPIKMNLLSLDRSCQIHKKRK